MVGSLLGFGSGDITAEFICVGSLDCFFISVIVLMKSGAKMDQKCL